jgi:mannose-1-phosphate guanylyltransferase
LHDGEQPKQFARVFGSRSLLRQTLDRISPVTSSDRAVIVTHRTHEKYLHDALGGARVKRILMQPEDRGTAAGILLPASWSSSRPGAVVAVFPSDHFVGDERLFAGHVAT